MKPRNPKQYRHDWIYTDPLKLHVQFLEMPCSVERTLLVPANINMMQLHYIVQIAMGWENEHLSQFMDREERPGINASLVLEYDLD